MLLCMQSMPADFPVTSEMCVRFATLSLQHQTQCWAELRQHRSDQLLLHRSRTMCAVLPRSDRIVIWKQKG